MSNDSGKDGSADLFSDLDLDEALDGLLPGDGDPGSVQGKDDSDRDGSGEAAAGASPLPATLIGDGNFPAGNDPWHYTANRDPVTGLPKLRKDTWYYALGRTTPCGKYSLHMNVKTKQPFPMPYDHGYKGGIKAAFVGFHQQYKRNKSALASVEAANQDAAAIGVHAQAIMPHLQAISTLAQQSIPANLAPAVLALGGTVQPLATPAPAAAPPAAPPAVAAAATGATLAHAEAASTQSAQSKPRKFGGVRYGVGLPSATDTAPRRRKVDSVEPTAEEGASLGESKRRAAVADNTAAHPPSKKIIRPAALANLANSATNARQPEGMTGEQAAFFRKELERSPATFMPLSPAVIEAELDQRWAWTCQMKKRGRGDSDAPADDDAQSEAAEEDEDEEGSTSIESSLEQRCRTGKKIAKSSMKLRSQNQGLKHTQPGIHTFSIHTRHSHRCHRHEGGLARGTRPALLCIQRVSPLNATAAELSAAEFMRSTCALTGFETQVNGGGDVEDDIDEANTCLLKSCIDVLLSTMCSGILSEYGLRLRLSNLDDKFSTLQPKDATVFAATLTLVGELSAFLSAEQPRAAFLSKHEQQKDGKLMQAMRFLTAVACAVEPQPDESPKHIKPEDVPRILKPRTQMTPAVAGTFLEAIGLRTTLITKTSDGKIVDRCTFGCASAPFVAYLVSCNGHMNAVTTPKGYEPLPEELEPFTAAVSFKLLYPTDSLTSPSTPATLSLSHDTTIGAACELAAREMGLRTDEVRLLVDGRSLVVGDCTEALHAATRGANEGAVLRALPYIFVGMISERSPVAGYTALSDRAEAPHTRAEKFWPLHVFEHTGSVYALAWHGELLAAGGADNKVTIRNGTDGTELHVFQHTDNVRALAWQGELLAAGGWDKKVTIRNGKDGTELHVFEHTDNVRALAWQGELLAAGGEDNKVTVHSSSGRASAPPFWMEPTTSLHLGAAPALLSAFPKLFAMRTPECGRSLPAHAAFIGASPFLKSLTALPVGTIPSSALLGPDADGLIALDHAIIKRQPAAIKVLLELSLTALPSGRISLERSIVRMAEEQPRILTTVLAALELEAYAHIELEPYLPGHRARINALAANGGRLALCASHVSAPDKTLWQPLFDDKANWTGPEVDVRCCLVGVPGLVARPHHRHPNVFRAITAMEDYRAISSPVMRAAIAFKWEKFGRPKWVHEIARFGVFFTSYLVGSYLLILTPKWEADDDEKAVSTHSRLLWLGAALFSVASLINLVYVRVELVQARSAPSVGDYLRNASNMIDLAQIGNTIILGGFLAFGNPLASSAAALGTLLMIPKAAKVSRGQEKLSFLIMMQSEILIDMGAFSAIILFVFVANTYTFMLLLRESDDDAFDTVAHASFSSYALLLGDFEQSLFFSHSLTAGFFVYYTVFVNIVLFNVLIAVISDTYERVQETSEERGLQSRATLLIEQEDLMSEAELANTEYFGRWLHVIERTDAGNEEDGWSGRLRAINNTIIKAHKDNHNELNKLDQKLSGQGKQLMEAQRKLASQVLELGSKPADEGAASAAGAPMVLVSAGPQQANLAMGSVPDAFTDAISQLILVKKDVEGKIDAMIKQQDAKIDAMIKQQDAKIDAMTKQQDAKIDAMKQQDAKLEQQDAKLDAIMALMERLPALASTAAKPMPRQPSPAYLERKKTSMSKQGEE